MGNILRAIQGAAVHQYQPFRPHPPKPRSLSQSSSVKVFLTCPCLALNPQYWQLFTFIVNRESEQYDPVSIHLLLKIFSALFYSSIRSVPLELTKTASLQVCLFCSDFAITSLTLCLSGLTLLSSHIFRIDKWLHSLVRDACFSGLNFIFLFFNYSLYESWKTHQNQIAIHIYTPATSKLEVKVIGFSLSSDILIRSER